MLLNFHHPPPSHFSSIALSSYLSSPTFVPFSKPTAYLPAIDPAFSATDD